MTARDRLISGPTRDRLAAVRYHLMCGHPVTLPEQTKADLIGLNAQDGAYCQPCGRSRKFRLRRRARTGLRKYM